jgi:hypothetical protein
MKVQELKRIYVGQINVIRLYYYPALLLIEFSNDDNKTLRQWGYMILFQKWIIILYNGLDRNTIEVVK